MGTAPPFMYSAAGRDSRFPHAPYDPKAVTRASWEPGTRKERPRGPLVSFNRHPDSYSSTAAPPSAQRVLLGPCAKKWIQRLRRVQLGLRVLQLNGAAGILTLMILIVNVQVATAWTLRIAPSISILHTLYAARHLSRSAVSRTPASSAAYHGFTLVLDLAIVAVYAFGAFSVHQKAGIWTTRLADQHLMHTLAPAAYYALVGTGVLHLLSVAISLWLGLMFRKIGRMPPDMNPLEDNLTARPSHKKNKSSIATATTDGGASTCSASLDSRNRPASSVDGVSRPPSIPFMYTRAGSSPPASTTSLRPNASENTYRAAPRLAARKLPGVSGCASYTGLPAEDTGADTSHNSKGSPTRMAKFTETWLPTDSLIARTEHRTRNIMVKQDIEQPRPSQNYSTLPQAYNLDDPSESEDDGECETAAAGPLHPNPLRSHPALRPQVMPATDAVYKANSQIAMFRGSSPSPDQSHSQRQASLSRDITDQLHGEPGSLQLHRKSSVLEENDFCLKPPAALPCTTPAVPVGGCRKISSGNDYGSQCPFMTHGRRAFSGRQAEEGRAGTRAPLRSCAV